VSRRGARPGLNLVRFERHSRRERIAGRKDVMITAATYLRASKITVITQAGLLRTLESKIQTLLEAAP
jgi:hypothetical protein